MKKQSDNRVYSGKQIGLCLVVMVSLAILGFIWWGTSLGAIVLFVLGLMCLFSAIYIWLTARRLDKLLERIGLDKVARKK
jgi:hypothetical protein